VDVWCCCRARDGKVITRCAASRNSKGYIALLEEIEKANPKGKLYVVADNLASLTSAETNTWLADHPRIQHIFIPLGACWLNLQEGWWRRFRRDALAGRVLPSLMRSRKPPARLLCNLTGEPNHGSGDDLP
jgi:DDE superfamily endonuclease